MGLSSDIMHDFINKEIKAIHSTYDGWKITEQNLGNGYDTLAVLERRNSGHREVIRLLATFSREVTPSMIAELRKPGQSSDGTVIQSGLAVMVPANADTSLVPADVRIYIMRSFAFEGKELIWIKKPVRKTETPKVTA